MLDSEELLKKKEALEMLDFSCELVHAMRLKDEDIEKAHYFRFKWKIREYHIVPEHKVLNGKWTYYLTIEGRNLESVKEQGRKYYTLPTKEVRQEVVDLLNKKRQSCES